MLRQASLSHTKDMHGAMLNEAEFHAKWPGEIFILESVEDVLKLNERFINEAI